MTDIVLSFDSEDYLTPQAADAELWWAENLTSRGLRGSWQLVGELIRSLHARGRQDVIAALSRHEIGFHSNYHSLPPTIPEVVEGMSLAEALEYIYKNEASGLKSLAETFARWPVSYCSPGDSWTPATLLAMARLGIKVFCNDKLADFENKPYWYCGLLVTSYSLDFQEYYEDGVFEPGRFARDFEALKAKTPADGVIVIYTHPTRLVTSRFWDEPFADGRRVAIADAPPAPLRPADEIRRNQQRCADMLDWLVARKDLRFKDFAEVYHERAASARSLDKLLLESGLPPGREGELPLRESGPDAYMPSQVFDSFRYRWLPYPQGFTGQALIRQARQLTWTAAPATRN